MEAITRTLRTLHEKHENLKHTVHTAWRYPLPRWGQFAMGCVYFTIPVVGGWYVMQWAISKSVEEIGERGEKLKHKEVQGYGNKTVIDGKEETIGAGGRYGGVHLAMSDSETQQKNMAMLKAMFEREKRRRNKEKKLKDESDQEKEQL
ncbi:hypothetical protein HJC23_009134 [Cyclotella cryptica]|uniref:Uncharacterized protein n=1 Tax=Cyclotella cryptica TaxID=29204 RepID=A0ABD3NZ17_9STRA|eukprot:CCRYP_018743-RA/>CCRYP_018743-RA protein AED:0.25 eAED:0.27 QI:0/0/0/1/1/1/2/0/147